MLLTVFGRRGSGKTTLIAHLIRKGKLKKPVVVLDFLGNYSEGGSARLARDPWVDCQSHVEALRYLKAYGRDPKSSSGIFVVQSGDIDAATDYVCSALWHLNGGTLVIDEADAVSIPEAPCFDEAIRYGRNRGIDIITGCRRPAEISKNITAGADYAYCLTTHEPRDILYYQDFLGEELALELPKLPAHHGIYRDFVNQHFGVFKTDESGKIHVLSEESQVSEQVEKIRKPEAAREPKDGPARKKEKPGCGEKIDHSKT